MAYTTTIPTHCATRSRSRKPLVLALVAALSIAPLAASAATISVTSPGDTNPESTATCTLRQAIVSINNATVAGSSCIAYGSFGSDDTITFNPSAFPTNGSGTITLTAGQLDISATDITIDATVNSNVTIDANHASRVIRDSAPSGSLSLSHLTLRNGSAVLLGDPDRDYPCGGGIFMLHAGLHLAYTTVSNNSVEVGNGGGIFADSTYVGDFFVGGSVTLANSTMSGNTASDGSGGGISADHGTVTLTNSTLSSNSANYGGGISANYGTVTLTSSTLSGNLANQHGGGMSVNNGTITLTSSTLTLNGNSATVDGGGIYVSGGKLTLTNSMLSGNSAGSGGGIYSNNGNVTATNSTLSGNTATHGGGVSMRYGSVTLTNSTLSGNSAGFGGGVSSDGNDNDITLINSTLSGNSATRGAGIYAGYGSFTLINTTVSGNTSTGKGGGIRLVYSTSATATNSIVAGNTQASGGDLDGDPLSGNNNLIGGNPKLGPLDDNGGPTQTMVPQADSPAINAGACHDDSMGAPADGIPNTDQRAVPRPQGADCDIGAVERIVTVNLRGLGQNGQYALAGDAFAWPLVVQALDVGGGAVSGVVPEVQVPVSGPSATCTGAPSDATGIARIACTANGQAGIYTVRISTLYGPDRPPLSVAYMLTNLPNDRIFRDGFDGTALLPPTGGSP